MGLLLAKRIPRGMKHSDVDDFDFIIGRSIVAYPELKVGDKAPPEILESENFGGWLRRGFVKFAKGPPPKSVLLSRKGFSLGRASEPPAPSSVPTLEEVLAAGYAPDVAHGIVASQQALEDGASEEEAAAAGHAAQTAYLEANPPNPPSSQPEVDPPAPPNEDDAEVGAAENSEEEQQDSSPDASSAAVEEAHDLPQKSPAQMSKAELRTALMSAGVSFESDDSKKKLLSLLLDSGE